MKIDRRFLFDAVILLGGYVLITLLAVGVWLWIEVTP